MKTINLLMLSLLFSLSSFSLHATTGKLKPYRGDLLSPAFTLTDVQGHQHNLSDYRDNIVLLQFWATYCTACREEMPTMNKLVEKMQGQPFKIVTVNMAEDQQSVNQFLDQVSVEFPVLLDSDGRVLSQWKVFSINRAIFCTPCTVPSTGILKRWSGS